MIANLTSPRRRRRSLVTCVALCLLLLALLPATGLGADIPATAAPRTDPAIRSYWTPERLSAAATRDLEQTPEGPPAPLPLAAGPLGAPAGAAPTTVAEVDPGSAEVATPQRGALESPAPGAAERRTDPPVKRSEIRDPAADPVRSHGKVFFTVVGGTEPGDYQCSGTAIASNNRSVVLTAGHCTYDDYGGGFVRNFVFIPGYHEGAEPFGEWPARQLAVLPDWKRSANLSYDLGIAVVAHNGSGKALTDVVGGRGIAFNQPRTQSYSSFGYPAVAPPAEFTGEREFRCDSPLGGTDNPGPGPVDRLDQLRHGRGGQRRLLDRRRHGAVGQQLFLLHRPELRAAPLRPLLR